MSTCTTLTRADLVRPLAHIFTQAREAQGGEGWPYLFYSDQHDTFEMRLTPSNGHGMGTQYSLSCFLNGRAARQLNSQLFAWDTPIGRVMMMAAGASPLLEIEEFFS